MKKYLINHPEYLGAKGKIVEAESHYRAAYNYAKYYNERSDYSLFDDPIEITVSELDGRIVKYSLSAERVIDYNLVEL